MLDNKQSDFPVDNYELKQYMSLHGEEAFFCEGEAIVRRGEAGHFFHFILEGEADVQLRGEAGEVLILRKLSEGVCFGEISILTGDSVSADVIAASPVKTLALAADKFSDALSDCPALRNRVLLGLSNNLKSSSNNVWNFYQRAKTLDVLLDTSDSKGPLVANTPKMKKVGSAIQALADNRGAVLITGEAGCGKAFVATKIHQAGENKNNHLIVTDCADLPSNESASFLFGSALFSHSGDETDGKQKLSEHGVLHLANRGTLVLKNIHALEPEAQTALAAYLLAVSKGWDSYPFARVIATTSKDISLMTEQGEFDVDLAQELEKNVITVPPLRERRKDILQIAEYFLSKTVEYPPALSKGAEHVLVSRRYKNRNVSELKESVELAALFAGSVSEVILPEHIFSGPKEEKISAEVVLSDLPAAKKLISDHFLTVCRGLVLAFFSAIIGFLVFSPETVAGTYANSTVWGLWWPSLIFVFLILGRLWCVVCPLSSAALLMSKIKKFDIPFPQKISRRSVWLIVAGFCLVVWSEHIFKMTENPTAAGLLLFALMVSASFFAIFFQRETWCRFLCPLGNLSAAFSPSAMLSVRANPNVCSTVCTTHECHKGSATISGCPVFHHPLFARDGYRCKLCFNCLKSCPHDSAKLYLRAPLQRVWRQGELGAGLSLFCCYLFLFALVMLASRYNSWVASPYGFTIATLLSVGLGFGVWHVVRWSFHCDDDTDLPARISFALLLLAWGPLAAFQTAGAGALDTLYVNYLDGSLFSKILPVGGMSMLSLAQIGEILVAGIFSAIVIAGIKRHNAKSNLRVPLVSWLVLSGVGAVYILTAMALIT